SFSRDWSSDVCSSDLWWIPSASVLGGPCLAALEDQPTPRPTRPRLTFTQGHCAHPVFTADRQPRRRAVRCGRCVAHRARCGSSRDRKSVVQGESVGGG